MSTRRFNEQEISTILKRATELQEQQDGSGAHTHHGLTLEEIQQIAHEVGVDPQLVEWAAEEIDQPAVEQDGFHLWGGPIKAERTRHVRGDLTDNTMDELVKAIRERLGQEGLFEKLGGVLTWKSKEKDAEIEIKAFPSDAGGTTLQSKQNLWQVAFLSFYLPLFFSVILGIAFIQEKAFLSPALEVLIVGVILAAEFIAIRTGYRFWSHKKRREMDALIQHLGGIVRAETPAPVLEPSAERQMLDLPQKNLSVAKVAQPGKSSTR